MEGQRSWTITKQRKTGNNGFSMGIETKIIRIDAVKPEMDRIKQASEFIKKGGIVVFPTETVYGIGASVFDEPACKKIFEAKGRPPDNPLIVTVSSFDMADEIAHIPKEYSETIRKIWPSPITFLAKTKKELPRVVTSGLDTVAIRMPAHPVALSLIKECGPIAGPSANPSKRPTATSGEQAIRYFNGVADCIIDSGKAFFGIESTIINLENFSILRPGSFTTDEIEKAFGKKPKIDDVAKGISQSDKAISPGTKYQHYSPRTPLFAFYKSIDKLAEILANMDEPLPFVFIGSKESCSVIEKIGYSTISLGAKNNLYEVAKNLYDSFIIIDSMNVYFGIIESFEENGIGLAIMNRIRKASSNRSFEDDESLRKLIESADLSS